MASVVARISFSLTDDDSVLVFALDERGWIIHETCPDTVWCSHRQQLVDSGIDMNLWGFETTKWFAENRPEHDAVYKYMVPVAPYADLFVLALVHVESTHMVAKTWVKDEHVASGFQVPITEHVLALEDGTQVLRQLLIDQVPTKFSANCQSRSHTATRQAVINSSPKTARLEQVSKYYRGKCLRCYSEDAGASTPQIDPRLIPDV